MATADAGTGAATAAAIMAFTYGGVTTEHFLLGAGCYVVGAAARACLKISVAIEAGQPAQFGRALASFSTSPFLGAFASLLTYWAAFIAGFEGDAAIGIVLAITAWKGPEGIQSLSRFVTKMLPDKFSGGAKEDKQP